MSNTTPLAGLCGGDDKISGCSPACGWQMGSGAENQVRLGG